MVGNAEVVVSLDRFVGSNQTQISQVRIRTNGRQVPIRFVLPYIRPAAAAGERYGLRAEILVDGQLRWESPRHSMVITNGVRTATMTVVGVRPDPNMTIMGKEWKMFEFQGTAVPVANRITIRFDNNGRMGGFTGVNNFGGTFVYKAPMIQIDPGPMTLRAGSPEQMDLERRYMDALPTINRAVWYEGELLLQRGEKVIARFR